MTRPAPSTGSAIAGIGTSVRLPGAALPLSFAQQRLWFLEQLEPGGFTYNVPVFLRLTGALDVGALKTGLRQVVARHEILRTRFVAIDGEPRQVIDVELAVASDVEVDVEPMAAADVVERARAEARRPFDLAAGPLLRARLLRVRDDDGDGDGDGNDDGDHVLLLVMHHIVCDGWSLAILVRELAAAYRAAAAGAPPLPPLAVQYADFACWQRQWLTSDRLDPQLAYWTEQLAGAPPALDLPTDRPRPAVRTTRGATVTRVLGGELVSAVRALSRQVGATELMTLLAAFAALLARITGQDDIVVGTPIAGRTRREVEGLIGFFVNTLVLRVDAGAPSFRALVRRVREVCLGAYAHQDLPFERLVDALRPDRALDRMPLCQVAFAPQNAPTAELDLPGVAVTPLDVHPGTAKFDLTVLVHPGPAQIATTWEYNTDLFERATIERIAAHYEALLAQLTEDPEQRPSAVPLVAGAERDRLLALGAVRADYPAHASLHALFEAQVARTPDATAVVFGDARLSYAELDARANRLARCLAAHGVGRGDRVGVCLGRSLDFIVAVVAVVKAGACYVPLDPGYPAERLAFMADDAGARLTITPAWLEAAAPELARLPDASPPVITTGRDLAYVMYTSGSTGRPKGACIEQRSIARLVLGTDYMQLGHRDVVGHVSNTSFDAVTMELWGALLNGAALHGIAPDVVVSPEALARELAAGGITALVVTAALFHQVAAAAPRAFHALDHLVIGGDAIDPAAVRRVLAAGPPRRLINGYGPTEATTCATWHLITEADAQAAAIPIGRPIANTTVRIVDRHGHLVPVGVRGELCIGGPGVARGYWNRPELTAERFIADPFEPGERLYRTGDLAAWRGDGAIAFHGRGDHQVKLRGFRIELGEIEARLLEGPELAEAAVIVRDDAGEPRLVAYVVPRAGAAADLEANIAAVRARLAAALPRHMLPGAIVALDRLPVTPNGKLDRRALPAPSSRRADLGGGYLAPDGELEQAIAQIWAEVLGVDRVGATDNFFDLGGSSLRLAQVRARIEARIGRPLAMVELFQHAQVRSLAAHLSGQALAPTPDPRTTQRTTGARRLAEQRRGRPARPGSPAKDDDP